MITLVKTTREIRLILKWSTVVIGSLTVIILFVRFIFFLNDVLFPKAPPPPEQGFGSLPVLSFNDSRLNDLKYSLNTTTGFLPLFPDRIEVYKVKEEKKFILTVFPVREKLESVFYTENEKKINEITYSWTNSRYPNKKITYNILTNDFDIEYDFYNDENIIFTKFTDPKNEALAATENFLDEISENMEDIDIENAKVTHYRIEGRELVEVERGQNPQIVKVELWHKRLNEFPILYEQEESPMQFFVGSGLNSSEAHIVEAHYVHRRIDKTQVSVYPLKITQNVYDELQNNKAYVVKIPSIKNIDLIDVYLAYYLPANAEYLRPVIVFEGNGFKAYTDAILQVPIVPTKKAQ